MLLKAPIDGGATSDPEPPGMAQLARFGPVTPKRNELLPFALVIGNVFDVPKPQALSPI